MDINALVRYLCELRDNNNKEWFEANRDRYSILRRQFQDLVGEVIEGTGQFDPEIADLDAAKAMFRINRDVRFSNDKSPYKVAFSAMFATGPRGISQVGYYVMIHADDELLIGAGIHDMNPGQLLSYRQSIVREGEKLNEIINDPLFRETFPELEGEKLKTVPKGFSADSQHMELLKYKSIHLGKTFKATGTPSENLVGEIISHYKVAYPLVDLLRRFSAQ